MKFVVTLLSILILTFGISTSEVTALNQALSLDGNGDFVEVSPDAGLDLTTQLTLEAWFTNNSPESAVFLIAKSGNTVWNKLSLWALYYGQFHVSLLLLEP